MMVHTRFNGSYEECASDVVIEPMESLRVLAGPVTGAAVSGVFIALITVVILYTRYLKHLRHTAQVERVEAPEEESKAQPDTKHTEGEEPQVNSDVAAFALKAKVVYPISQRYRPLADGASNPSLHEQPKLSAPPNQDSSSSSGDDWLSQEREDDESSQFISCSPPSKTHGSYSFRRVQQYPQTLYHTRGDVVNCNQRLSQRDASERRKVSLLYLRLQDLELHTAQLQQEKYWIFLQVLGTLLDERENAAVFHQQQQEVEVLMRGSCVELLSLEHTADPNPVMCSVEEVEKTGREKLDHTLQTALSFAKQLQQLSHTLHSRFSGDVTQEVMRMLMRCLRLAESRLGEIQASAMQVALDRCDWWEELSGWLRERTALLKQEAEFIMKLTGQSVEQLRADGQTDTMMNEFNTTVTKELQHRLDDIRLQTEELAREHSQRVCVRRRRLMKAQSSEWSHMLESHRHTDTKHTLKVCEKLQMKHWKQTRDFEVQQDKRITDSLCELWTRLCSNCSRCFTDLWSVCIVRNIPAELHQSVMKSLTLTVTNQMQRELNHAHTRLHVLREQLQRDRQVWTEEEAVNLSGLHHFGEQQRKIIMMMISRHSHMQKRCSLMEEQHHLLVLEFQRILTARYLYLQTVRDMRLTHLKIHSHTEDTCVSVAMETLPPEAAAIGQNLRHEQLSELETASEMLQGHAHFLFGHVLRQTACASPAAAVQTDTQMKERLIEAVCESVYITRDSVFSLIREYYSRIQHIAMTTQQQLQSHTEDTETHARKAVCTAALLKELNNCTTTDNSAECYRRVIEQKRRCLIEFERQTNDPSQRICYREQLREEEKCFISRLAALARVSSDTLKKKDSSELQQQDRETSQT